MRRYALDIAAQKDLRAIYKHVRQDSAAAAQRLRELFLQKFRFLAQHPEAGESREDLARDLRLFTAGNFAILFRAIQDGVAIARVIHGARDLETIVRGR